MKKLLLATVFSLAAFCTQARAQTQGQTADAYPQTRTYADMTNPFYIPERGFMADSRVSYSRVKLDASINAPRQSGYRFLKNAKNFELSETLTYGITGTWAVYGTFAYDWTKKEGAASFRDWSWTIGTKVNTIDEAWRVQIGADVTRTDFTKWKGVINEDQKDTHLYLMAGTETGEKVFAYTRIDYHNIDYGNEQQYDEFNVEGALHILAGQQTTADAGLRFTWDTLDHVRNKDLTFFAGGYMNIYQNMALGVTADYTLASSNNIKEPYSPDNQGTYTLGFNVKYEF